MSDSMIPDPSSVKEGIRQSDGWFTRPRAVDLLAAESLVVKMFEEVGIGFVGDAAIRFLRRDECKVRPQAIADAPGASEAKRAPLGTR